jgi:hypothetical protein
MWDKIKAFLSNFTSVILIGFIIGSFVAGYTTYYYQKIRIQEAITLGCFLHDKTVYEVKMRP